MIPSNTMKIDVLYFLFSIYAKIGQPSGVFRPAGKGLNIAQPSGVFRPARKELNIAQLSGVFRPAGKGSRVDR